MTYLTYITYTYVHCIAFTFNILQLFMFHLPITSCHFPFTIYQLPVIYYLPSTMTYTHMHTCINVYLHTCLHESMNPCTDTHAYTHVHVDIRIHTYIHAHVRIYVYRFMQTHMKKLISRRVYIPNRGNP